MSSGQLPGELDKDYRGLAISAYALVAQVGLLQALAYWRSQGAGDAAAIFTVREQAARRLADDVCRSITLGQEVSFPDVVRQLRDSDGLTYRSFTVQALEFLRWLRLFAGVQGGEQS